MRTLQLAEQVARDVFPGADRLETDDALGALGGLFCATGVLEGKGEATPAFIERALRQAEGNLHDAGCVVTHYTVGRTRTKKGKPCVMVTLRGRKGVD